MKKPFLRLIWILLLIALLYWALKNAPLTEIWSTLSQLQLRQIAALIGINAGIYALITLRWWIITHANAKQVPYFPLLAVRVAVFGVSYFTLGPQVGGEPLQVLALRHRYGLTYTRATSTVVMDKLLEFLANFILLAFGLAAITQTGFLSSNEGLSIAGLLGILLLVAWPPIHIILLRYGKHPVGAVLRLFARTKFTRFIIASERLVGSFCQRHFKVLLAAASISLLAALGMLAEYFMIANFLQIELSAAQTIAAWTAGWLSFLVPWPGGLGALEASQVFALGAFGVSAASAIGVTFLIRARDLLIGGIGLLLAGRGVK
ncbi:MAG: flippase-like domain-containing protein [Chloroflexi bacterium]|nr:flippase-like domain-containing protein [Chloroflexota bacterium]